MPYSSMQEQVRQPEQIIQATPISSGIAIGRIHVLTKGFLAPDFYKVNIDLLYQEKERFLLALKKTKEEISRLHQRVLEISGEKDAQIFEAHILFLEDKFLISKVEKEIDSLQINAEAAFYNVIQNYLEVLNRIPDAYLREKTSDIEDISIRVLHHLENEEESAQISSLENLLHSEEEHIIIAYDLTPSETASINPQKILGFATEIGSSNSHTSILARSMGIPAIVGINREKLENHNHEKVILDGFKGIIILNPEEETLADYKRKQELRQKTYAELEQLKDLPAVTQDGRAITLAANVEFPHEFDTIQTVGAEGIGLFRTEFFLLGQNKIPSEEEQTKRYSELVQGCAPHRVIFRTLDAGGDKLNFEKMEELEPNPFLGWRGIRVSLSRQNIFKEQLKAILRSSIHGPIGVMFPLISGLPEVLSAKKILEECKNELIEQNIPLGNDILIGVMIEVPSAAIISDLIAPHVDFFSIGTNDLTQYTIAVDRINHRVSKLFKTSHPAVIRLMHITVRAGEQAGIPTSVCGEVASDLQLLPLIIGLGASELSVGCNILPIIRYAIRSLNYEECQKLAEKALVQEDDQAILELSKKIAENCYPKLFS